MIIEKKKFFYLHYKKFLFVELRILKKYIIQAACGGIRGARVVLRVSINVDKTTNFWQESWVGGIRWKVGSCKTIK